MCLAVSLSCAGGHEYLSFTLTIRGYERFSQASEQGNRRDGERRKRAFDARATPGRKLWSRIRANIDRSITSCGSYSEMPTSRPCGMPHPPGPGAVPMGAPGRDPQRIYKPGST